jgi:transcriptional regulator GlxA family with amidase domain
MAEQAGMSSRHFARAFIAETGTTPSKAVERLRIEVARQRVQSSSEAIEHVAPSTGFRDPERLRPRLRPAAAIAAPRGAGGVGRVNHKSASVIKAS